MVTNILLVPMLANIQLEWLDIEGMDNFLALPLLFCYSMRYIEVLKLIKEQVRCQC